MNIADIFKSFTAADRAIKTAHGAVRRLHPDSVAKHAKQHYEEFSTSSEIIRRLPKPERDRISREIKQETETLRRAAAGAALHDLAAVRSFVTEARDCIAAVRRDTERSFPRDVFSHVSADGMITLGLVRLQLRSTLARASVSELLDAYSAALMRQDAAGVVEAEVIEAIVITSKRTLATNQEDAPIAKRLRDYVSNVSELRLPADLPDLDSLEAEFNKVTTLASAVNAAPTDPSRDHKAASALEHEREEMLKAGSQSLGDFLKVEEAAS